MGFAGGLMSMVGDDVVAVYEVRGEHAVVSGEMGAGARHRASSLRERHFRGGEAGDKVHRVEHDMSRPVVEGVLESIHDLPAVIDREAFVRDCRAGDVVAKAFEGVALMGLAARADPRLHHSGAMEGESRELSDAGVVRQRVGRDDAQGQDLAPGVWAGGDAVVDGGAEQLLETVGARYRASRRDTRHGPGPPHPSRAARSDGGRVHARRCGPARRSPWSR